MKLLRTLFFFLVSTSALAGVNIEHWATSSGARVYFVAAPQLPMLDVAIKFVAGEAYAPATKAGLASLTHGLLDAGAAGLDEEQIAQRLADSGARLAGSVDEDGAMLTLRTLTASSEREAALELLRAVSSAPTFPEAALAREKTRAIAALREGDTRPEVIAAKRFAAAIYPGHPYGVSPTAESVAGITREDVLDFYRRCYTAKRAVISLVGAIRRAEAEAIAERLTADLPTGDGAPPLPPVSLPEKQTITLPHPAAQSHILLGLPAVRRGDADYFPLLVGNYSLGGGGFVSRLMQEVREKRGYAYSVESHFEPRRQPGPFQIGLQTKREQTAAALAVVEDVLTGFIERGPTAAELAAAKKNLVAGFALRLDSNAKLLGYLSLIGFYDLPLTYLDDFPARVEAVTAEQVRAAFARHVPREHRVTVIVAGD